MSRKRCHRRPVRPLPPPGMRPKLSRAQVLDLALAHMTNLDVIARGEADEEVLWQVFGGGLTWLRIAERLQAGVDDMREQIGLCERLAERFERTGRVAFSGPEYQLAKQHVEVMDALAQAVDQHVAAEAADWSEEQINRMARAARERRLQAA